MRTKKFKWGNPLFVAFLAVAGIFGISSVLINKQAEETPVVEKAEATDWDGTMTLIRVEDSWNVRTLKLCNSYTFLNSDYNFTLLQAFVRNYYENEYNDWNYQTDQKRYKFDNGNVILLSAGTTSTGYSDFYLPSWLTQCEIQLINIGNTFKCGWLNNLLLYPKRNWTDWNTGGGYVGSAVGCTATYQDWNNDENQCKGYRDSSSNPGHVVTITKKCLTSSSQISSSTSTVYLYSKNNITSPSNISNYFKMNSSWYKGTTFSGATDTYTIPSLVFVDDLNDLTIDLVAKYVGGKYIFFTDNKSRSINNVIYEGPSVSNTGPGGDEMHFFYVNRDSNWVYYALVPEDTTKLIFTNGEWGGYNQTIDITGFTLNNCNGWVCTDTTGDNKYYVKEWIITSDVTPLYAGETLYIYRTDAADDSDYAVYFFNQCGEDVVSAWSSKAEEIEDAGKALNIYSGNNGFYKVTVPSDQPIWSRMIVVRYKKAKDPSTDKWGGVDSQTPDLTPNGTKCFGFIDAEAVDRNNNYNDTNINANIFGYHLITKTSSSANVCAADGSTNLSNLETAWSSLKSEYDSYNLSIQGAIYDSPASETGTSLEQAMARYDYIVFYKKYTLPGGTVLDFVGRDDSGNRTPYAANNFTPFNIFGGSEENVSMIIIIVASSVALLSVTALSILVIKKRKTKED